MNKVYVQEPVYDDFVQRLEQRFAKLRVGNHFDKCNDFGPLANQADFDLLKETTTQQEAEFGTEVFH